MPPRWVSAAILVTWVGSGVWLFWVEFWPSLEPDAPPPLIVDLFDEPQTRKLPIDWRVFKDGEHILNAVTLVEPRPRENAFTLHARFEERPLTAQVHRDGQRIRHMTSAYRVTADGHLLGIDVTMEFDVQRKVLGLTVHQECKAHIWGEVRNGQFTPQYELSEKLTGKKLASALPPVQVSSRGSVLLPLHPINRLEGIKPGQRWRVPVVDPLADAFASLAGGEDGVRYLRATVRPQVEVLLWNGVNRRCFVIDYREEHSFKNDKMTAETWVCEEDGLVLRQAATLSGVEWKLDRLR